MDNLHPWIAKGLYAVAVATMIGGGGTVLRNSTDVAVLQAGQKRSDAAQSEIKDDISRRLDRMEGKLDKLIEQEHIR